MKLTKDSYINFYTLELNEKEYQVQEEQYEDTRFFYIDDEENGSDQVEDEQLLKELEEAFIELLNPPRYARKCNCCSKGMSEGYCIDGGGEYYCTEECLNATYSPEIIKVMGIGDDDSESYWTEWYDPADVEDSYYTADGVEVIVNG